jgi:hypothetical protein
MPPKHQQQMMKFTGTQTTTTIIIQQVVPLTSKVLENYEKIRDYHSNTYIPW